MSAYIQLFPRADITSFRILQGPEKEDTNTLLIDQNVDYFHNPNGSSPMKTINSLLTLKLNDQGKIINHTEEWNHKKSFSGEDGFIGMINEQRKKLTAKLVHASVRDESSTDGKEE